MFGRPKAFVTPRELADALGVSESSLKRWADEGRIQASRTAGGHRRIPVAEAVRFIRESRLELERPELLGFDELVLAGPAAEVATADALFDAFTRDDWRIGRSLIVSSYLAGASVAAIGDGPVREALRRAGELWLAGREGIVVEHRAVDTCLQAFGVIRSSIRVADPAAPLAVGGAVSGDPYVLPSLIAATVLAEVGFRDVNLGPEVPTGAMEAAIDRYAPAIVWRSVSIEIAAEAVGRDVLALRDRLAASRGNLVVGGRGFPADAFTVPERAHHLASMGELAAFARGLLAARASEPRSDDPSGGVPSGR
ncbi:MAG: helix-turn-helix domain-containing protein [Thermodesulfobacteriota bacterium]